MSEQIQSKINQYNSLNEELDELQEQAEEFEKMGELYDLSKCKARIEDIAFNSYELFDQIRDYI